MANTQLSDSRQRLGSALIYAGFAIAIVGWVPVSFWLAPADLAPVVTIGVGLLVAVVGMGVVFNKVVCAGCAKSHWIIGRPTRLNCAHCGTPFF